MVPFVAPLGPPASQGGRLGRGPARNDEGEREEWNRANDLIAPD